MAGYSITHAVFERRDIAGVAQELERALTHRSKAGARHVLSVPAVRALASDPRLIHIAARFVGGSPIAFRATLFDKSARANWLVVWHQDTALPLQERIADPSWGPWSAKRGVTYAHAPSWALARVIALRVHLDDSTSSNGPLRVLPDTHQHGLLAQTEIDRLVQAVTPIECIADAGAVVAMWPLIVHASSKATDGVRRRVLHIEYAADVELGPGIELAVA